MRDGNVVKNFDVTNKLEINQRVEFEIRAGEYEGQYSTQVADIIDDKRFVVNVPFSQGRAIRVSINTKANIFVRGKTALYSLPVRIVEKDFDATHLFVVEVIGTVRKIQERRYFRLEMYKEVNYKLILDESDLRKFENIAGENLLLDDDSNSDEVKDEVLNGMVDDISAGGLKLITKHKLEIDQLVELELDFISSKFETTLGRVIRVNKIVKNDNKRYEAGIKFLGLGQSERDDLMNWLFAKQRELRKKGLI